MRWRPNMIVQRVNDAASNARSEEPAPSTQLTQEAQTFDALELGISIYWA